jgi:hypothetical protein
VLVHNADTCGDPSWIKRSTFREIKETLGKPGIDKFVNAMKKGVVPPKGTNGIKSFSGEGVNIGGKLYKYEIKIKGKMGDYRIFGNPDTESGHIIFDLFRRGLH